MVLTASFPQQPAGANSLATRSRRTAPSPRVPPGPYHKHCTARGAGSWQLPKEKGPGSKKHQSLIPKAVIPPLRCCSSFWGQAWAPQSSRWDLGPWGCALGCSGMFVDAPGGLWVSYSKWGPWGGAAAPMGCFVGNP